MQMQRGRGINCFHILPFLEGGKRGVSSGKGRDFKGYVNVSLNVGGNKRGGGRSGGGCGGVESF